MREDDHNPWSQLADLRRRLVEAEGQRDHYARRALEAERRVELYEASLVMLAKEMDRPREDGSA